MQSNKKIGLAFIYLKYDSPEYQDTRKILSLFIRQLCLELDQVPDHLLDFHKKCEIRSPTNAHYISELKSLARLYQEVFIVIDALDEFNSQARQSLLDILQDLTAPPIRIKIFVSSRRETDIETAFTIQHIPVIQMDAADIGKDVDVFVKGRMEEWVRAPKPYLPSEKLRERVISTLVSQAHGMYVVYHE